MLDVCGLHGACDARMQHANDRRNPAATAVFDSRTNAGEGSDIANAARTKDPCCLASRPACEVDAGGLVT